MCALRCSPNANGGREHPAGLALGAGGGTEEHPSSSALASVAKFLAASPDISRLRAAIVPSLLSPTPAESVTPAGVLCSIDGSDQVSITTAHNSLLPLCLLPEPPESLSSGNA